MVSDVLDKIKTGLHYASNYLETAKDIADLVSKSLGHNKQKQKQKRGEDADDEMKQPFGPSNLISAFFRLIGLDSPKVAAIAVNSFIFLAQMVRIMPMNVNVNCLNYATSVLPSLSDISLNYFSRQISSLLGVKSPQGNIARNTNDAMLTWDPMKFILENKNDKVSRHERDTT